MREVYEGRRGIILRKILFWGKVSLGLHRGEFEFCSREGLVQGAPVCWGFWARGLGYPYGILELGSCPSWQGGYSVLGRVGLWIRVGQGSSRKVNRTSGKRRVSIRPRYLKLCIFFILL
jgi:hypothetical protein